MPKSTTPRKRKPQKQGKKKANPEANSAWNGLPEMHAQAVKLISSATQVSELYKDPQIMRHVKDRSRFNTLGNILLQDMNQFSIRLQGIKDRHVQAPANEDDPDNSLLAISIGEMYTQWMADWSAVIPPTIAEITTLADGASEEQVQVQKAQAAADGNENASQIRANAFGSEGHISAPAKAKKSKKPAAAPTAAPKVDLMAMARGENKKK